MKCVNDHCNNETNDCAAVVVNIDGDQACCQECSDEYEKQRDHFMNVVIHDDVLYEEWIHRGKKCPKSNQ